VTKRKNLDELALVCPTEQTRIASVHRTRIQSLRYLYPRILAKQLQNVLQESLPGKLSKELLEMDFDSALLRNPFQLGTPKISTRCGSHFVHQFRWYVILFAKLAAGAPLSWTIMLVPCKFAKGVWLRGIRIYLSQK
jgi:hypothetical protein